MIQQMHVKTPIVVGLLSSSVGIGFLLGVLILPRIHRRMKGDCLYLGVLTAGLVASGLAFIASTSPVVQIALFVATAFFGGGVLPSYWAIAMKRLQGIQAAAGLAFINTIGLIGGFVGPYVFGMAETASGKSASGFTVVVAAAVLGLVLVPLLAKAIRLEARPDALGQPALEVDA
jgi:MFS family permease